MSSITLEGSLFTGVSLKRRRARLILDGELARLELRTRTLEFPRSALQASPRVFETPRFVALPNGWQFVCAEHPALERLAGSSATEGPVAWLEARVGVALGAVLATLAGIVFAYVYGLPWLADAVAARVPVERERALGERVLQTFDTGKEVGSWLDQETIQGLRRGFTEVARGLPAGTLARVEFRNPRAMGPNAFALPGGVVVITDDLVNLCPGDESIAVLAHELGHVRHRHPLRLLVQQLGVGALGALFGTDASTLSLSLSALPVVLATAHYSQGFELDADAEGFALAARAGYSPELFATCLEKLSQKHGTGELGVLSYLSSHPPDAERLVRARRAAREFVRLHPETPK